MKIEPLINQSVCMQNVFSSGRVCFVPWYEMDSTRMEMLRVRSMEEILSLPLTQWNIRQHRGEYSDTPALTH